MAFDFPNTRCGQVKMLAAKSRVTEGARRSAVPVENKATPAGQLTASVALHMRFEPIPDCAMSRYLCRWAKRLMNDKMLSTRNGVLEFFALNDGTGFDLGLDGPVGGCFQGRDMEAAFSIEAECNLHG